MHKLLATPEEPLQVQPSSNDRLALSLVTWLLPLSPQQAGLSPTSEQIEAFSDYLPGAALHEILVSPSPRTYLAPQLHYSVLTIHTSVTMVID